ncbi:MAG: NTP transferase domain-containing protein [Clostridia bacterium]|nr:NTP transferase domain-containing protein [Clostridia bacterium]
MTAALIIAAGKTASKERFDPAKRVGSITAIERVVLLFREAGIRRIVVVDDENETAKKLVPSMNITFLTGHAGGEMLHSVQEGLKFLSGKCEDVFISTVDLPMFSVMTLQALKAGTGTVRIPCFEGRCGHPMLLCAEHFDKILAYRGEGGLKGAVRSAGILPTVIDVSDPGILSDIQKDSSYEELLSGHDIAKFRFAAQLRVGRESVFYGPGIHQLLQLTEEFGSLLDACRHMGISYSKGRKILSSLESQLGCPVLESRQGGKSGGSSRLTDAAQDLMRRYGAFCAEADTALDAIFRKHFGDLDA